MCEEGKFKKKKKKDLLVNSSSFLTTIILFLYTSVQGQTPEIKVV